MVVDGAGFPFQRIIMALITHLPKADKNMTIMVAIDHFWKYAELIPLKNKRADTIEAAFVNGVICNDGLCSDMHMKDNLITMSLMQCEKCCM